MITKQLSFDADARESLLNGIKKLSGAVKSTLGPSGNTVLIESNEHTRGLTVTKDGVTVAKSIFLKDPIENLAVRVLKEAAKETATEAGDGTTTSIVLAEELILAGTELIKKGHNRTMVLRYLQDAADEVIEGLGQISQEVGEDDIMHIATISGNNDPGVGKIVSDVYKEVGRDGIVTVEYSQSGKTYYETTKGIKVDRGYTSPLFINNRETEECVLKDAYVLLCDTEISTVLQVEQVMRKVVSEGLSLLIIAPCSQNMINTLAANAMKKGLKVVNIPPPDFGFRQHELMQDIAAAVGATYFSEKTGDDLSIIQFEDLGRADKVVVGADTSIVIGGHGDIDERLEEVLAARGKTKDVKAKVFLNKRIASLRGGVGVIHAGGATDLEQKELYDRIDDSICAVRSALEEGVLPGAGRSLFRLSMSSRRVKSKDKRVAIEILNRALRAPMDQILRNAGLEFEKVYGDEEKDGDIYHGYDIKSKTYGDLRDLGVIDPAKVTRTALQNAISVAVTILSTNCVVTMDRD